MIGKQVAQFLIQEKLGEGGMGVVYKALDQRLNRPVALKFLPTQLSSDPKAKARFMQEAQAASQLDHANICTIYEIGETEDGQLFIAMAFYDGETLKYRLDGMAQTPEDVRKAGRQLASALDRAHKASIVHRDLKPANVMWTTHDEIKLLDFGLAKLTHGMDLTVLGSTVGTAAYMSPEQMRGEEVGSASDVWSLGALLYEMATGSKPFTAEYDQALMYAILNEPVPPVSSVKPDFPEEMGQLIDDCLSKDASRRPTMAAIKQQLTTDTSGTREIPSASPASSGAGRAASLPGAIPFKPILAGLGVVAVAAILWLVWPGSNGTDGNSSSQANLPESLNQKSVAVLPFTILGGTTDEEAAAFAGGIHDNVLSQLSRIADLTVISRTSVMQYANTTKPLSEIAQELGVANLLEGSVQKAGNRVRINTSLLDASSGAQIWSDSYDEELTVENIFAIQSDLSQQIAEALEATLTAEDRARLQVSEEVSQEAYDLFTRGVYKARNLNTPEDLRAASEMLRQVTLMAPDFAKAHAELSFTYQWGISRGVWTASERQADAKAAAERAGALNPDLPEAIVALSGVAQDELRFQDAEALLERAISLAPGEALPHSLYANLLYRLGRPEEALASAKRAVALDPLDISTRQRLADVYFFIGMYEETVAESRKILEMKADDAWSYYNIGYGMALLGRTTEAVAAFQKAVDLEGDDSVLIMGLAWGHAMAGNKLEAVSIMIDVPDTDSNLKEKAIVYGVLGDLDTAFEMLYRAFEMNPGAVSIIAGDDSVPEAMRRDPRFQELLKRMGLEFS
ncbi:MAG: protein kinase [Bacteroidetes bacterium]|nr:protein kinase [Bacteroidota bacterium]